MLIIVFPARVQGQNTPISDSVSTFLIAPNLNYFLGFGMSIVEKGQEDFTYTKGYCTNEQQREFTDSTLFNLGSVSKLFTAIAILKLASNQDIKLDDPIYYYFPEFLNIRGKSRRAHEITILDLLQHRSGINQSMENLFPELFSKAVLQGEDQFYENTFNYRAFMNREDFKERFEMYARIDKKPRKKYHFSNLGFVILGYIVEEVSGMNLGQFVTNQILVPLGMNDSHYYETPDSLEERLSRGYYRLSDGSYLNVHDNEVESPSPTGDGGIKTTLRDMRKFMHFLVGDLQNMDVYNEILPRTDLLSMIGPLKKGPDKQTWVGLGFHNLQPYNFAGHAGGWDGFLSILYYHPESHSSLFLVTNREDNQLFLFLQVYAAYAMLHRKL
ncbi:MAG: beta-lactamase family protein [Bacteroidia bacterium]|nr:beta-lactamase family protein [Bacteroidia bacterium]